MHAAVRPVTRTYTLTAAPVGIHTVFGYKTGVWVRSITLRAARANSGDVYWAGPELEAGGYLEPGEAATIDMGEGMGFPDEYRLSGILNDRVFITMEVSRYFFEHGDPTA